jgi:hypothetical protein
METQNITVDREEARALYRKYREHQHYSTPLDLEIQRVYDAIAKGRVVIRALASIAQAGLGEDHLPKLAIVRANATDCFVQMRADGSARFSSKRYPPENHWRTYVDMPAGSFPERSYSGRDHAAQVPLVPIHLRPKRGLENYHVLFEAIWRPVPPVDPLLVRRVGRSDLWIVCAAWDLSEIERAVLAGRL